MSSGIKINESPSHFMVLDPLARGIKDLNKISKITKLARDEVELISNDLTSQRLVTKKEKFQ